MYDSGAMLIRLKVHPGSKKDAIEKKGDDRYEVWVRAPAAQNRANVATLILLGRALKVPAKSIRIIKGSRSPSKIVEVPL